MLGKHLALLQKTVRQLAVLIAAVIRNDEGVEQLLLLELGRVKLLQLSDVIETLLNNTVDRLAYHVLYLCFLAK